MGACFHTDHASDLANLADLATQMPEKQEETNSTKEKQLCDSGNDQILRAMSRQMTMIRGLINDEYKENTASDTSLIKCVCLMVVVDAEIRPIMERYKFARNEELCAQFLGLGIVSSGQVKNLTIYIIKVAESKVFKRHYSGYTQSAALAALVASIIRPDIVISFGTAGGITELSKSQSSNSKNMTVKIGDVMFGEACLFLDRLRTRNKNAFDWGLWGGSSLKTNNLTKDLGLVKGIVASQIGYMINEFQAEMIGHANIMALDMECAPIAQILNQTGINFFALKVISNGIYPGNPSQMESEYHENREMVSKKATEILVKVIDYLNDKQINEL